MTVLEGDILPPRLGRRAVNKVRDQNFVNRPAKVPAGNGKPSGDIRAAILAYLTAIGPAKLNGDGFWNVKGLPSTGDVIDALGRDRTPANYASVSRSLSRMQSKGLIVGYEVLFSVGKGYRWGIAP